MRPLCQFRSNNVRPCSTGLQFIDYIFSDAVNLGDLSCLPSRFQHRPDIRNIECRNRVPSVVVSSSRFGISVGEVFFAHHIWSRKIPPINSPSFCLSVSIIVKMSSEPEMLWINACSIVACMTNKHSIWDCAIRDKPRNPMCDEFPASRSRAKPDSAIPTPFSSGRPFPTWSNLWSDYRAALVHLPPKSILVIFRQLWDWSCSHMRNSLSLLVSVFRVLITPDNALTL